VWGTRLDKGKGAASEGGPYEGRELREMGMVAAAGEVEEEEAEGD
jgi:hypothetical protein